MNADFYALRLKAGFNCRAAAAEFCGVTEKSVRNWEKSGAPVTAIRLMGLLNGDLSNMGGKEWRGVWLEPDCISISKTDFVYPCEIGAIRYLYQAAGLERHKIVTIRQKSKTG